MCTKCRKKRSAKVSGFDMGEFFGEVPTALLSTGAKAGGFALGMASNKYIQKIEFVSEALADEKKHDWAVRGIGTAKALAAYGAEKYFGDGGLMTDAFIGFGVEGAVEVIGSFVDGMSVLSGIGYAGDMELLGTTVEIDLDELNGSGDNVADRLLDDASVASADHMLDDELEDAVLADDGYEEFYL